MAAAAGPGPDWLPPPLHGYRHSGSSHWANTNTNQPCRLSGPPLLTEGQLACMQSQQSLSAALQTAVFRVTRGNIKLHSRLVIMRGSAFLLLIPDAVIAVLQDCRPARPAMRCAVNTGTTRGPRLLPCISKPNRSRQKSCLAYQIQLVSAGQQR